MKTFAIFMVCLVGFSLGCNKNKTEVAGNFEVVGNPDNLVAPIEGISKTYPIQSDGQWLIDVVESSEWLTVHPTEGAGDGEFTVTIDKNRTSDLRQATLIFRLNFERQDQLLRIKQEPNPNPPYFNIAGGETKLDVTGTENTASFAVSSNTLWQVIVPNGVDWIHVEPASGTGDGNFSVRVDANPAYTIRSAGLKFNVDGIERPEVFMVTQEGKVDETVILNEDFNWLSYGSAIFYTTTGETRSDAWSAEEKDRGWTSSVNTVAGSGNTPLLYARQGFVKVGKTSYGGDLITPKLEKITGTKNLQVSFKAVPYQTLAGTRDGNALRIQIIGPGTASTNQFVISNWPDYSADPDCTEIWKASETTRTFTVTGATAETQIVFLGGEYDLRAPVDPNKNRIFLDDIIITTK